MQVVTRYIAPCSSYFELSISVFQKRLFQNEGKCKMKNENGFYLH